MAMDTGDRRGGGSFRRDRDFYQQDDRRGGGNGGYDRSYDNRGGGFGYRGGRRGGGRGYDDRYQAGPAGGRGGGRDSYYDGGYQGSRGGGGRSYRARGGGRYNWGRTGGRGRSDFQYKRDVLPDDITALTELKQHTKQVTCLHIDQASQLLYTAGQDGLVNAWSCSTGELKTSVPVGMEVDSLLVEAGYLIVGMHNKAEGIIKIWNLATGDSHQLTGHKGQVLALAAASGFLFSGGQDASIRVWAFNPAAGIFVSQAILTADSSNGHRSSVQTLTIQGQYMFSGDRHGNIKVWDLQAGTCVQTVEHAHAHAVMKLLLWGENYLLSASLDGAIKCWSPGMPPATILNPEPEFTFTGEEGDSSNPSYQRRGGPAPGVLTIWGTMDAQQKPILMTSYNEERCIRLFELPSFESRGTIPNVWDCRTMTSIPAANTMLAGDRSGSIKVFQWKPAAA
eukprot:jgi/Chrzof1/7491/Cz02g25260.t1